jgi:hypothetical protein
MLFYVEFTFFFGTVALPQENLENYGFYGEKLELTKIYKLTTVV